MDSLKRIMKSAMDDRSSRFILGTIALGVVVALFAGTLIGYKLDNSGGGSSGTKKATTAAGGKKPAGTGKKAPGSHPVLFGDVVAARPAKIVVVGADKKRVPLNMTGKSRAETASPSSASSIVVGSHVLFAADSAGTTASEVVILPATAAIGQKVTAVSAGQSMTLKSGTVVKISGASVLKAVKSSAGRIPKGAKVAVLYFTARKRNRVYEVTVLPATSKL